MQQTNLTLSERERLAYVQGDTLTAQLFADMEESAERVEFLEEQESELRQASLSEWERRNGSADAYKEFFDECFKYLAGHYPCPEVTSDYDKSVIFAAIERGEAADAEGGE